MLLDPGWWSDPKPPILPNSLIDSSHLSNGLCFAMQLLAYRNQKVVAEMLEDGLVTFVHQVLDAPPAPGLRTAQAGTVFLLAAAIAFCETSHAAVIDSGLVKQLVALCRDSGSSKANIQHSSSTPFALPPQQSQEEPTSPGGSSVDLASSSVLCGTCLLSSTRSLSGSLDEGLGSADLVCAPGCAPICGMYVGISSVALQ